MSSTPVRAERVSTDEDASDQSSEDTASEASLGKGSASTDAAESDLLEPPNRPDPELALRRELARASTSLPPARRKTWMAAFRAWAYPLSQPAVEGKPGAPRLEALDAPRWIASIQIVAYHFYAKRYDHRLSWGGNWTQFFFILSGFILSYVEMAKPKEKNKDIPVLEYVRKRMVVAYPSYLLSILLVLCTKIKITLVEWVYLPFHMLMLQSWLPICLKTEDGTKCMPWSWNGEAWFMSVLLAYWLLLRPLASRFRNFSQAQCWLIILLCWACSILPALLFNSDLGLVVPGSDQAEVLKVWMKATPMGYFHVFVAGIAGARIFILTAMVDSSTKGPVIEGQTQQVELEKSRAPAILKYGCCIGYLIWVLLVIFVPLDPIYYFVHQGGLIPLMLLIILGAAVGVDPLTEWVFKCGLLLAFGRFSYVQYLNQSLIWHWMQSRFLSTWGEVAIDVAYPFILMATAYFMQRWFETPYTEWQRIRMEKKVHGLVEKTIAMVDKRHNGLICVCSMAIIVCGGVLVVFLAHAQRMPQDWET